jgi:hypothetical protein
MQAGRFAEAAIVGGRLRIEHVLLLDEHEVGVQSVRLQRECAAP